MAGLSHTEKLMLEKQFSMDGGYVLDFSNNTFQRFIKDTMALNIYEAKYSKFGSSKANHLRAFWEIETDIIVGKLVEELLQYQKTKELLGDQAIKISNPELFQNCLKISHRLQGKSNKSNDKTETIEDFLKKEVDEVSISSLNIDSSVTILLEQRILEVKQCLKAGAPLSVIFLCGSILEGILLGAAIKNPKPFNQASSCPKNKDTGKPKQFHEWALSHFIDVAYEISLLGLDVKKYSHSLRDFRNYIHPFEQMSSGFKPDAHTAKISWQVLKAAIHDIYEKTK